MFLLFFPHRSLGDDAVPPIKIPVTLPKAEQARVGSPVRLKIPKIKVNAVVEHVGVTAGGAMDTPKNSDDVAWFNLGVLPGEVGAAVIDGHYGTSQGKPAAFDNLYKLRPGDKIYVEDETGATVAFVVRESRRYDEHADATNVFSSQDGIAHLNLITCEGVWNKISRGYSQRLVVFADRVDTLN